MPIAENRDLEIEITGVLTITRNVTSETNVMTFVCG